MTASSAPAPEAGFYADPLDPSGERWWDGLAWTETVRPLAVLETGAAAEDEMVGVPLLAPSPLDDRAEPVPSVAVPVASSAEVVEPVPEPQERAVPAGFYPDPYGQAPLRWWDGQCWTVRTSAPSATIPPQPSPATTASSAVRSADVSPAVVALPVAGSPVGTVLPTRSGRGNRPTRPSAPASTSSFAAALAPVAGVARRMGARGLAAVLVLAVGVGARSYLVLDARDAEDSAPARVAAAVNLRPGDLPAGWTPAPAAVPASSGTATAEPDPAQGFEQAVGRCSGAADRGAAVLHAAASPTWTRGTAQASSDVTVVRSAALAAQDLRAQQSPAIATCISRDGLPGLRAVLARSSIALRRVTVQRLPGAAADAFALRLRMDVTAAGKPLTLWTDSYGFVRGSVEVGLTVASAGAAPDRAVAARALTLLRERAGAAVPMD